MGETIGSGTSKEQSASGWRQWVEPWYFAYALLGCAVAGLLPILLPLVVNQHGSAAGIGLVMAAVSLGGLSAPLWGVLADRRRLHRWLLTGGLAAMAGGLAFFSPDALPGQQAALALLIGLGAAGAATVANLFVVEVHPKTEWDERIGWLQTFYGVGQVAGLLLAGLLSQIDLRVGLGAAAGVCAAAAILGWLTTSTPPASLGAKPVLPDPARHGDWAASSPQKLFHLDLKAVRSLGPSLRSPFGVLLAAWLLSVGGAAAYFSLYPVLMQVVFAIPAGFSSLAFAAVAGLGLLLYSPAGSWSERRGAGWVLRVSWGIRLAAYAGLFGLAFFHFNAAAWLAILGFGLVVCAWSLISVSGTALAAQLSPVGEGEGLGIFNAVSALAGVLGAAMGGWAATRWGYASVPLLGIIGLGLGLALGFRLPSRAVGKDK
jgi:DHA1 family tetracycline resistance protein-like MFS transporter